MSAKAEVEVEKKEKRALTINDVFAQFDAGLQSRSGQVVNTQTALTSSPVWQAIDLITSDISRAPFLTYEETEDGGRRRAVNHPVYRLLRRNTGEMTSNLWVSRMVGQALLYGNGYSRILFRNNRVSGLQWLHNDDVMPKHENGEFFYVVNFDRERHGRSDTVRIPPSDMIHLVGLTIDAFEGLSLIKFARHAIGRGMSGENYADDFYNNDATPAGWFEHPGEMSPQAQENFLKRFQERHQGSGKRFRHGVLEEGMKYTASGVTPRDAQLVDQLKLSVKDVARYFNVPPHKLGDSDKVSFNSLEEENRSYFDSSLGKWVSRLEYECTDKLFGRSSMFAEFLQDAWFKADTKTRFESYRIAIDSRIMSPNEVRLRENLNPYDGGDDFVLMPGAVPADDEAPVEEEPVSDDDERSARIDRAGVALRDFLAERLRESVRLLSGAASRSAKKDTSKFLAAINELDSKFRSQLQGKLNPAVDSVATFTDQRIDITEVVDCVLHRSCDEFLSASECPASELTDRVSSTAKPLEQWATYYATTMLYGDGVDEET